MKRIHTLLAAIALLVVSCESMDYTVSGAIETPHTTTTITPGSGVHTQARLDLRDQGYPELKPGPPEYPYISSPPESNK